MIPDQDHSLEVTFLCSSFHRRPTTVMSCEISFAWSDLNLFETIISKKCVNSLACTVWKMYFSYKNISIRIIRCALRQSSNVVVAYYNRFAQFLNTLKIVTEILNYYTFIYNMYCTWCICIECSFNLATIEKFI